MQSYFEVKQLLFNSCSLLTVKTEQHEFHFVRERRGENANLKKKIKYKKLTVNKVQITICVFLNLNMHVQVASKGK